MYIRDISSTHPGHRVARRLAVQLPHIDVMSSANISAQLSRQQAARLHKKQNSISPTENTPTRHSHSRQSARVRMRVHLGRASLVSAGRTVAARAGTEITASQTRRSKMIATEACRHCHDAGGGLGWKWVLRSQRTVELKKKVFLILDRISELHELNILAYCAGSRCTIYTIIV